MVKIGPNEKCPCNSGKKYKKCCNSPEKMVNRNVTTTTTKTVKARTLKVGGYVILENRPCEVLEIKDANGQPGYIKTHVKDIFNGHQTMGLTNLDFNIPVPHVTHKKHVLKRIDMDNRKLYLDDNGTEIIVELSDNILVENIVEDILNDLNGEKKIKVVITEALGEVGLTGYSVI